MWVQWPPFIAENSHRSGRSTGGGEKDIRIHLTPNSHNYHMKNPQFTLGWDSRFPNSILHNTFNIISKFYGTLRIKLISNIILNFLQFPLNSPQAWNLLGGLEQSSLKIPVKMSTCHPEGKDSREISTQYEVLKFSLTSHIPLTQVTR